MRAPFGKGVMASAGVAGTVSPKLLQEPMNLSAAQVQSIARSQGSVTCLNYRGETF